MLPQSPRDSFWPGWDFGISGFVVVVVVVLILLVGFCRVRRRRRRRRRFRGLTFSWAKSLTPRSAFSFLFQSLGLV